MSIHHRPHGGNANPHDPWTCNLSPNWPHDCPQCMADYPPPPDAWELARRREQARQRRRQERRLLRLLTRVAQRHSEQLLVVLLTALERQPKGVDALSRLLGQARQRREVQRRAGT